MKRVPQQLVVWIDQRFEFAHMTVVGIHVDNLLMGEPERCGVKFHHELVEEAGALG